MANNRTTTKRFLVFPFKVAFHTLFYLVVVVIAIYLFRQLMDGRAILYPSIGLWLLLAYITLPRLHRFLTRVYLPNYYIGRTRTGEGFLGDPVNLAFNGTEADIKAAMRAAGWVEADELNLASSLKMVKHSLLFKSYPNAPVSSLYLFSNKQDFAFQQEVGGTTSKRHHIRFWKCPDGWYVPGGYKAEWLAAGSYDRKVGFSLYTMQITHKIAESIDEERDFVIASLKDVPFSVSVETVEHYSSAYHDRNGGGDRIKTDGAMPFVTIRARDTAKLQQK